MERKFIGKSITSAKQCAEKHSSPYEINCVKEIVLYETPLIFENLKIVRSTTKLTSYSAFVGAGKSDKECFNCDSSNPISKLNPFLLL
jgi:hypothetical protein